MRIVPYRQGALDAFCGIYAIVNSVKLVNRNIREEEAIKLFGKCMRYLEKYRSLGRASTAGIEDGALRRILMEVVTVKYKVKVKRPFYRLQNITKDYYFKELQNHFQEGGRRSAIISIKHYDFDHWTVVKSISSRRLSLYDSCYIQTINIAKCVVGRRTKEKYLLSPQMTYFISAK